MIFWRLLLYAPPTAINVNPIGTSPAGVSVVLFRAAKLIIVFETTKRFPDKKR